MKRHHTYNNFRILTLFLSLALLLTACQGSQTANYHVGTEGIVLSFTQGTPPAQVYEESDVPVFLELWNKGATDVLFRDITLTLTTDPFYATVKQAPMFDLKQEREELPPDTSFSYTDYLLGRQPGYSDGERRVFSSLISIKKIQGLREEPTSELFASVCYPYRTEFGETVCVDTNAYNQNQQRQVCQAATHTYQSQGAPVAVTQVENRPTPVRRPGEGGRGYLNVVQPTFIIHLRNVGRGTVLLPLSADAATRNAACAGSVARELRNRVGVNVSLSGVQLQCDPNPVLLQGGEGYTTCKLVDKAVSGSNYLGILTISLDYLYRESMSAHFSILRRAPGLDDNPTVEERGAHPGYVHGEPRCDYCSRHRNAPECRDWPSAANATAIFTCACGEEECLKKARLPNGDVRCVYGKSWCPGSNYCCVPG